MVLLVFATPQKQQQPQLHENIKMLTSYIFFACALCIFGKTNSSQCKNKQNANEQPTAIK